MKFLNYQNSLVLSTIVILFIGCSRLGSVRYALSAAGDNRVELEAVIKHYEKAGDKQKLAAARFIIANMPGHKSMVGDYESYYRSADSMLVSTINDDDKVRKLDSLSKKFAITYQESIKIIKSDYLISDIDMAFSQWREGEWSRHLDFMDFEEILLPYTCSQHQPVYDWRDSLADFAIADVPHLKECYDYENAPRAAVCRVNDALKSMIAKQKWLHTVNAPTIYRPSVFVKLPGARCDEYAEVATLVMRSKGLPISIDFTTQWPDRLYGHTWCVMRSVRGKNTMFNPFAVNPDYPHYVNSRISKVFRRTYSFNRDYIHLLRQQKGRVPNIFADPFFKDVSKEYFVTSNLKVRLLKGKNIGKTAYIAVFDNYGWKPVFWGDIHCKKAIFKNMGRRIMYMAMVMKKGVLVPASLPFYVDDFGNVTYISRSMQKTVDVTIDRKSPMFQNVYIVNKTLHGGIVSASDDPKKGFHTVVKIPDWPLTSGKISTNNKKFRYWKLSTGEGQITDIAELYFYESGESVPIHPVTLAEGQEDSSKIVIDNDPLTYFSAAGDSSTVVIDLVRPVAVSSISYIKRGDGNAITPGDTYDLYYWDDSKWVLNRVIKAVDVTITVKGLPYGGLYYIKDISRGQQNRIFRWDDERKRLIWN